MNRLHLTLMGIVLAFTGLWGGFYLAHVLDGWLCLASIISGVAFIVMGIAIAVSSVFCDEDSWEQEAQGKVKSEIISIFRK